MGDGGSAALIDDQRQTVARGSNPLLYLLSDLRVEPGRVVVARLRISLPCTATSDVAGVLLDLTDDRDTADGPLVPLSTPPRGATPAGLALITEPSRVANSGSTSSLLVSLQAPSQVGTGQTVSYQVTLTHPTTTPEPLTPCPTYVQELGNIDNGRDARLVSQQQQLNCPQAPTSPAGGSVTTFDMRITTGRSPTGVGEIDCQFLGSPPLGYFDSAPITVTRQ